MEPRDHQNETGQNDDAHKPDIRQGDKESPKGKGNEESQHLNLAERIKSSSKMAAQNLTTAQSPLAVPSLALAQEKQGANRQAGPSCQSREVQFNSEPSSTSGLGASFRTSGVHKSGSEDFSQFLDGADLSSLTKHPQPSKSGSGAAFQQMEANDGSAVVDLLTQPESGISTSFQEDPSENISPETVETMRASLFDITSSSSHSALWDDLLNLTPRYVLNPAEGAADAQLHFGTSDPHVIRDGWIRQWGNVLSSYADEVWGDLLPLAREARQEVADLSTHAADQSQEHLEVPSALGRLRMILTHLRGS
jgi:hypothetical protein